MLLILTASLSLLTPPPLGRAGPALPRRACLAAAAATAAGLHAPPAIAIGESLMEAAVSADPLIVRLKQAREGIAAVPLQADSGDWAAVRKTVSFTLPFLTLKGYTGESVKSRAASLKTEQAKATVLDQRSALLVSLAKLDKAAYAVQIGKTPPAEASEVCVLLAAASRRPCPVWRWGLALSRPCSLPGGRW